MKEEHSKGETLVIEQKIPETKIDKARIILYIYNEIRKENLSQIRGEEKFLDKIEKQFKKKVDYLDIIEAIWILQHNSFATGDNDRNWSWDIDYLFDARGVDKAFKYKTNLPDTQNTGFLRTQLKYLIELPPEYKEVSKQQKSYEKMEADISF